MNLATTPTGTNEVVIQMQDKIQRDIGAHLKLRGRMSHCCGLGHLRKGTWRGNMGSWLKNEIYIPVSVLAWIYYVNGARLLHLSESQICYMLNRGSWADGF